MAASDSTPCPECEGRGQVVDRYYPAEYVTADMASDAGDPAMAGMLYRDEEWTWTGCERCKGTGSISVAVEPTP